MLGLRAYQQVRSSLIDRWRHLGKSKFTSQIHDYSLGNCFIREILSKIPRYSLGIISDV